MSRSGPRSESMARLLRSGVSRGLVFLGPVVLGLLLTGLAATPVFSDELPSANGQATAAEIEGWIDDLAHLSDSLTGSFFSVVNEGVFLPNENGIPGFRSEAPGDEKGTRAARRLIACGPEAVPHLLAHLDDHRPTAAHINCRSFYETLDYNHRPEHEPPFGVRLGIPEKPRTPRRGEDHFDYRPTVGDAAFEVLGQIVNRDYHICYLDQAGADIISLCYSDKLRLQLKKEWGDLTRAALRDRLVADFRRSDSHVRRKGAYLRLLAYFPDAVEETVLGELRRPTYSPEEVKEFLRTQLEPHLELDLLRSRLETFVDRSGPAAADGLRAFLFEQLTRLEYWEADEEAKDDAPGKGSRRLLVELFHYPPTVRGSDAPPRRYDTDGERAELLRSLTRDSNRRIGDLVAARFRQNPDHPELAAAALCCLANRGYPELLIAELDRIRPQREEPGEQRLKRLEAISLSRNPRVHSRLKEFAAAALNAMDFAWAIPNERDESWNPILIEHAARLLKTLPEATEEGAPLLGLLAQIPGPRSQAVIEDFLKSGNPERIASFCELYWGEPRPPLEHLLPLLDDRRRLVANDAGSETIRDLAAAAIASTHPDISYESDWGDAEKDETIRLLREYCLQQRDAATTAKATPR